MTRNMKFGIGALIGLALAALLAFGVFGIQTAFIDDEVSEANPFATVDTDMAEAFDDMEEQMASGEIVVEAQVVTTAAEAAMPDMVDEPAAETTDTEDTAESEAEPATEPAEPAAPVVRTIATNSGDLVNHAHSGEGTVNVISNGTQTFLRFEDDFAIDNGPDLNVYLVRGTDASGPAGEFDDDFIDLGDLKGNIGAQNYELPVDLDIAEYDTVVIWCVRFGVAFNAANLS